MPNRPPLYLSRHRATDNTGNEANAEVQAGLRRVTKYHLRADRLGSSNVSYRADGQQTITQRYYPWGTIRPGPDNALPTDYTFTGQKLDESTGLMYYGARYYDPALGRFVQADTIVPNPANPQDLNRYAYVRNNPLRYTDPSGHADWPGDGGEWWEEASLPPTWYELSQEEQLLAYRAYLDFLENPGYYRALYLDPTSEPGLLAPLLVWAEYRENTSFVLLLEVDLWQNSVAQIEGAQQLRDSGVIDDAEYWKTVAGPLLALGLMEKAEGTVAAYSDAWYKATFPSSEASAQYHYGKHRGPWNSIEEYTEAARQFYAENINLAQPHPLYTGETGVKIRTDQYFGIYTTDGRIISFGER